MNISSKSGYPASNLSNFSPHKFTFKGLEINSMEGFLQGLKFKNPEMQKHVFTLVGKKAKYKGKRKNWYTTQTLWFQGEAIKRNSTRYQKLLLEAYYCMFSTNSKAKKALLATGNAVLKHSIGKKDPTKTVLTEREFTKILTGIRFMLKEDL